ncbi:MAG: hypothetical protein QNJ62_11010 [Methyloceanibacter sp.]|nr:hypothetical protein [Methyloceanibacter sp.]
MRDLLKQRAPEVRQFAVGLVLFSIVAGLVVAYSTPIQDAVTQHPGRTAVVGVIAAVAMMIAAYINFLRYVSLVAIPLALACAVVWVLLTVRTLNHFEFYARDIARSVDHIPQPSPNRLSDMSSADRKEVERAPRQLQRSSLRLRHHLDRHAFWSKLLLTVGLGGVAVGLLSRILRRRRPPHD